MTVPPKISLEEKLSLFDDHWSPRIVAEANGQLVKVAKLSGEFVWHDHADEDEIFLVLRGRLRIDFREGAVELGAGELVVVPRGVEHRPVVEEGEVHLLLIEPASTRHTGTVRDERTVEDQPWI